ncbi:MAG TPA: hypothetical protein VFQ41_11870 [Candidatus Angelobacter sp.]|nr:hypothetical protein [Candidatus Angelobacter sp.]
MLEILICYLIARLKFRDYRHQPVTLSTVKKWLTQFDRDAWAGLRTLLRNVVYFSERDTRNTLSRLNRDLILRLQQDGVKTKQIIYVQVADAGSSSPMMLGMLRDIDRLDSLGCTLLDSKDVRGLTESTDRLQEGAIVYVDDFAGSGRQFCESRDFVAEYVVGNFVEYFLAPSVCEEAVVNLKERGIEPKVGMVHRKRDRILHPESAICSPRTKQSLVELCSRIDRKHGLGFRGMATMVVFYRNTPNSSPVILRGNKRQIPFRGLVPRADDLPPHPQTQMPLDFPR